jgi:hypothetical protein
VYGTPDASYGNASFVDTTSAAVDVGGSITLVGYKTAQSARGIFGLIKGGKENATSGNEASYLAFHTNNNTAVGERMRITSGGLVGLGTSIPTSTLHVQHPAQTTGYWEGKGLLIHEDATANQGIAFYSRGSNEQYIASLADDAASYLIIGTRKSSSANNVDAITIRGDGKVGIGTTSPSKKLEVAGDILMTGLDGFGIVYSTNAGSCFLSRNGILTSNVQFGGTTSNIDVGNGGGFQINPGKSQCVFSSIPDTANIGQSITLQERMRIDTSGRLLVGTSTSTGCGELLRVEKASTGTEGAGIRFGGTYSIADGVTQTFTVGNGSLIFVSDNTTGDGGLFFCGYKSATVTLIADPNSRYANSDTSTKICVFKSVNTTTVSLKNRTGGTLSFTIGKINNSD